MIVSPAKTAELIETPFGLWTQVGQRNCVLDGNPDVPHGSREEAVLRRGMLAQSKAYGIQSMCVGDEVFLSNYFERLFCCL